MVSYSVFCTPGRFKVTTGDCGQNPRLFLKEEKGFGKVHKGREAEGNRSLHQVFKLLYLS